MRAPSTGILRIRRYEPEDEPAVRRLHDDALNEAGAHPGNGPRDDDLDEIENVCLDRGGEVGRGGGPFDGIFYEREFLG